MPVGLGANRVTTVMGLSAIMGASSRVAHGSKRGPATPRGAARPAGIGLLNHRLMGARAASRPQARACRINHVVKRLGAGERCASSLELPPFPAAEVRLEFIDPAGADGHTGADALFPTAGRSTHALTTPDTSGQSRRRSSTPAIRLFSSMP